MALGARLAGRFRRRRRRGKPKTRKAEDEESRCTDSVLDEPVDVVLSAMFGGGDLKDIRHAEQSFLSFTVGYHLEKGETRGRGIIFFLLSY